MRHLWLAVVLFQSLGLLQSAERTFDFSKTPLNSPPAGFRSVVTGKGELGNWLVVLDDVPSIIPNVTVQATTPRKPVIAQLSRQLLDDHVSLLILDDEKFSDFTLSVRFKTVSGVIEQMAGLAFRIQDEKNYYYVRASSKGRTFRFFKVTNGELGAPIGPEIEIPTQTWHEMRVKCRGNQIQCWLNGNEVIPTLTDNSFNTGKIGLWTKSDSVSHFTDLTISYTPHEGLAKIIVREVQAKFPRLLGLKIFSMDPITKEPKIIASTREEEVGKAGSEIEKNVLLNDQRYAGPKNGELLITVPLHDKNGEVVAAVKFVMKPFIGQSSENALARALPLVREMEARIRTAADLF